MCSFFFEKADSQLVGEDILFCLILWSHVKFTVSLTLHFSLIVTVCSNTN
jgi:hypothetical protein